VSRAKQRKTAARFGPAPWATASGDEIIRDLLRSGYSAGWLPGPLTIQRTLSDSAPVETVIFLD
jgi:hypothetical protein